jgi:hypothetical protein
MTSLEKRAAVSLSCWKRVGFDDDNPKAWLLRANGPCAISKFTRAGRQLAERGPFLVERGLSRGAGYIAI